MSPASGADGRPEVALAHDYLLVMRGAERTFAALAEEYPQAPIHTLLYDEQGTGGRFSGRELHTSPLQRLQARQGNFRRLLPLLPWAARRLRPQPCEAVLTSSSAFAHGLTVPPGAIHVCYCHAPFRYAWYEQARALAEVAPALRPALRAQLAYMRRWDRAAAGRVDDYIANSQLTRERIARFYGRSSTVIHPPVETERFSAGVAGERLLVVTELVPHKRVRVALEAARRAGAPIAVVGSGPQAEELARDFPEAELLGRVDDRGLAELYAGARAVLVPAVEEFGIVAVEAQAAGRPVIAAAAGGALETVLEGRTGRLVAPDDVDAFAAAITSLEELEFDSEATIEHAAGFSVAAFRTRIAEHLERLLAARPGPRRSSARRAPPPPAS